jgi:hypothetical protein
LYGVEKQCMHFPTLGFNSYCILCVLYKEELTAVDPSALLAEFD